MPKRVLDTNILIERFRTLRPYAERSAADAEAKARGLIKDRDSNAIVSPVEIEFLVGIVDRHEMALAEAFLRPFELVDGRSTLSQDWEEARRIGKHIGFQATARDLGDCLISAVARRLNREVASDDKGVHCQLGRTSRRHR